MKKLSLVALLVTLSACKSDKLEGEAIHATVVLDPGVRASCVLFEVRDASTHVPSVKKWLPRTKNELQIAVFPGSLPTDVELAARPYQDGSCENGAEARTPNGAYVTGTASFVQNSVTQAPPLKLLPGRDGDGDQYVSSDDGGSDCKDALQSVNPGVQEQCTDQEDLNCDGKRGCEASACGTNACFRPPANLVVTLPTSPVPAGACTSGTVQLKDDLGGSSRVTTATDVSLASNPSNGITFYSDASCTTPRASTTLAAQEGAATFFFQGQVVGTVTVSASMSGVPTGTQSVQIIPGAGNRLVFLSQSQTVTAGACSPQVQVQSQDAQGNAAPVTSATTVSLSASPSTGFEFFTTSNCSGTAVSSIPLASGASTTGFYFRGARAGSVSVSVAASGFSGSSLSETIQAGPPAVLVLAGPTAATAGACSSSAVTLTLQDNQGNPTTATTAMTVTLSTTGRPLTFSTSSTCSPTTPSVTISQGSGTASFYFQGTQAGASTIQATSGALSGTLPVTINAGPPSVLVFTTPAQVLQSGSCSSVRTVQLQDSSGNPVTVASDTSVGLSVSPVDGVQFFTSSSCMGTAVTVVTMPTGSSNASFYFKAIRSPAVTLTASVGTITKTQNETINPGAPSVLVLSPSPLSMTAGDCKQVNLQVQDSNANASPVTGAQTVGLTASPATGFTISVNADCSGTASSVTVSSGQASAVFYVKGIAAGNVTVTASKAPLTDGTLTAQVSPAAPTQIVFKTAAQRIEKEACSGITTLEVQDTFNNPSSSASSRTINLTGSTGTLTFYQDPTCTGATVSTVTVPANQSSASFYFKDTAVESVMITASDGSLPSVNQTEIIDPLHPTALAITTTPQALPAGGCSGAVTVETRAQGSATPVVADTQVALSASPSAGFTFYSNSGCTGSTTQITIPQGQSSASYYFVATKAGTITMTATSGALSVTQDATISALAPSKVAFSTPSYTPTADVCSPIVTINSVDTYDNVVAVTGDQVVDLTGSNPAEDPLFGFYSNPGCTTPVTTATFPSGQSSASFYFKGRVARTVTVTAGGGASGFTNGTQNHTLLAANATTLAFSTSTPASPGLLAGTCTLRTLVRRDAFGNLAPDATALAVNLSGSSESDFFTSAGCTNQTTSVSIPAGASSVDFYFKGYIGGVNSTAPLTLTAVSSLGTVTQMETILPTVRPGNCTMSGGAQTVQCAISPALGDVSRAFLIFQASTTSTSPSDANVRCRVLNTSQVECHRPGTGAPSVSIRFSVAEFPPGVAVQALTPATAGDTTNVALTSVVRAQSFTLLSSERSGGNMDPNTLRLVELTSATQAQIRKTGGNGGGDTNNLQVVEYPGAAVQRGLAGLGTGAYSATGNLSPAVALDRSILLYSYDANGSGNKICDRGLRGELTNATTVTFTRGDGDTTNCGGMQLDVSWEVVQFPVGTIVQQIKQRLTGVSTTIPLQTPVDPSRSLVIGGGQWSSGQAHGEGSYSAGEVVSEVRGLAYLLDGNSALVSRASSNSPATFTIYVVQFRP